MKKHLINALAIWASELDKTLCFDSADCCDKALKKVVLLKSDDVEEDLAGAIEEAVEKLHEEKKMDDGRFGLNDPNNPEIKAASLA